MYVEELGITSLYPLMNGVRGVFLLGVVIIVKKSENLLRNDLKVVFNRDGASHDCVSVL